MPLPSDSSIDEVLKKAGAAAEPRRDWNLDDVPQIYHESSTGDDAPSCKLPNCVLRLLTIHQHIAEVPVVDAFISAVRGVVGLGKKTEDHIGLPQTVTTLPSHPDSFLGMLCNIATDRILMPSTIIRIAFGRGTVAEEQQATWSRADANSIYTDENILTTEYNGYGKDKAMPEIVQAVMELTIVRVILRHVCSCSTILSICSITGAFRSVDYRGPASTRLLHYC